MPADTLDIDPGKYLERWGILGLTGRGRGLVARRAARSGSSRLRRFGRDRRCGLGSPRHHLSFRPGSHCRRPRPRSRLRGGTTLRLGLCRRAWNLSQRNLGSRSARLRWLRGRDRSRWTGKHLGWRPREGTGGWPSQRGEGSRLRDHRRGRGRVALRSSGRAHPRGGGPASGRRSLSRRRRRPRLARDRWGALLSRCRGCVCTWFEPEISAGSADAQHDDAQHEPEAQAPPGRGRRRGGDRLPKVDGLLLALSLSLDSAKRIQDRAHDRPPSGTSRGAP